MRIRWTVLGVVVAAFLSAAAAAPAWANSVTPMCTTAQGGPSPCVDGWYTTPVELQWQVTPFTSSQSSACGVSTTFSSDINQVVACDANWSSPPDIQYPYQVRVEISSPTVTATLSRPPDSNGWYNHPVGISFGGSSFSGIASCTPAVTYGGASGANVTLSGSCTDNAGKTATASVAFNYDSTAPTIIAATPARKPAANGYYTSPVNFTFKGTDPVSGIASCQTVTYRGPSSGSVVGGCWNLAGNYATMSIPVKYRTATPAHSATRAGSSLRLRWKKAAHATYYNVQVYRGKKKVLSAWPSRTSLLLHRTWKFAGHRYKLKPGRYGWYVWPGFGARKSARYGRRMVAGTFKVTKPA